MNKQTDKQINCNCCKHLEGCMLELSKEHINPDEYVCSNFEKEDKEE